MSRVRIPRVLMLGWEYPPRFAGGLGKACRGLSLAMARRGAHIFFVLPTFPERIVEPQLEVLGAREAMREAGWPEIWASDAVLKTRLSIHAVDAQLFPYGAAPEGPAPETIREFRTETEIERRKLQDERKAFEKLAATEVDRAKKKSGEIYGKNLWSEIERYALSVRKMAETHEVDLVHAHDWMTFPAAFEFQRVAGVPVFLHVHATEYDRSGEHVNSEVFRIEREGFRRATHIFAVSRYTAGIIERLYGVNRKKITVVYNAPDEDIKQLKTAPDAPREEQVIFLGRLTFQKGPDHFLRAAALVAKANKKARFIICGNGDMFGKLRSLTHRLGIEDRVHFAGFVDPSGVDEILSRSKVLVMPSVSEPFGLVALEAIHCGIPVIISKQSGVREVLHRALQVDFWDHEKLADQVLAALRLPELSRQLVGDGMDQIVKLSWDRSARHVIEKYEEFLTHTYAQAVEGAHGH